MDTNIQVSVHGKNCVGCKREDKPIMISLDGKYNNEYKFLDAFLTTEEAIELIKNIQEVIRENECKY